SASLPIRIVYATRNGSNERNTGSSSRDIVVAVAEPQRALDSTQVRLRRHARSDPRMRGVPQEMAATQKSEPGTRNSERFFRAAHRSRAVALARPAARPSDPRLHGAALWPRLQWSARPYGRAGSGIRA